MKIEREKGGGKGRFWFIYISLRSNKLVIISRYLVANEVDTHHNSENLA